jgi:hypothetical protein
MQWAAFFQLLSWKINHELHRCERFRAAAAFRGGDSQETIGNDVAYVGDHVGDPSAVALKVKYVVSLTSDC